MNNNIYLVDRHPWTMARANPVAKYFSTRHLAPARRAPRVDHNI
jgi:hypothetical protein